MMNTLPLLRCALAGVLVPAGAALAYTLNGYTFNDGPVGTGRDNAAVMVHGWNSDPGAWANSMSSAIVNQLTLAGRAGQWDTWSYNWSADADNGTFGPNSTDERNAHVHGQHLADWLIQQTAGGGYSHVHLMGHSLGGRVIDSASAKLRQAGMTLHATYFDAYTPGPWENFFGENADYAEHYYNDDNFISHTQDNFVNAHNVEVTDESGGPGSNTFGDGHSWPYQWYRNSVNNGGVASQGYGYALSKEYQGDNWSPPTNRPAGNRVNLPGDAPPGGVVRARRATMARKSYSSIVNAADELTLTAGQSVSVPINTAGVGSTNYLDFRFDFASRAGGNLVVQVNGNTLTHVQEAFSLGGFEWSGKLLIGSDLGAGTHTVTFSLSGGDSVVLDDISLGSYRDVGAASPGDSDNDGDVDLIDLGKLASFYGLPFGMDWDRGDFDLDGDVDLNDLGALASNYNAGAAQAFADFAALSVPEPGALRLLACISWVCLTRNKRRASRRSLREDQVRFKRLEGGRSDPADSRQVG